MRDLDFKSEIEIGHSFTTDYCGDLWRVVALARPLAGKGLGASICSNWNKKKM